MKDDAKGACGLRRCRAGGQACRRKTNPRAVRSHCGPTRPSTPLGSDSPDEVVGPALHRRRSRVAIASQSPVPHASAHRQPRAYPSAAKRSATAQSHCGPSVQSAKIRDQKRDRLWPLRNPNFIPPSGRAATNCAAAWMPASTRTTSSSCCSSSTSATNTPASPTRRSPFPQGASFKDMVALKGKRDIGDQINKKIIAPAGQCQQAVRHAGLQRRHQARQRQGDGGPAHQPHRHLREQGARLLQEPRRRRRHPRRRLRIPDAALRHRERQEQGPVLHPRRGQPHHRADHRHPRRQDQRRHHRLRPDLRLRLAAAEGRRRGRHRRHALRAGEGRRHQRPRPHEHDPAQQPHRAHRAGQHADRPQVQGRRHAQDLRLRRRQSAIFRQALEHRPRSAERSLSSASSPSARRPPSRATTPTCCTSSARSRAPARARASCRTACCSAATPRPTSAAPSSARATSRASSACPPTSSTAPASPPASSSSTRRTPTPARASS